MDWSYAGMGLALETRHISRAASEAVLVYKVHVQRLMWGGQEGRFEWTCLIRTTM
jgi:hypothetical protein